MQRWRPLILTLVVVLGTLASGCANPPDEEMARAEQGLQAARDAEASTYAHASLRDVALSLRAAQLEVVTQSERFAIMRKYDEAIKLLKTTLEKAEATRTEAIDAKEAARMEAEARLGNARQAVSNADTVLVDAPRAKGTKADILALTADLDGIRGEVNALEAQIEAEEYFDAHDKAASIVVAAEAITAEIQAAIDMQARLMDQRRKGR